MPDTHPPGYTERRPDIRRMFKDSRTPLPDKIRVEARDVAARMFGLGTETSGPCAPGDHLGPYRIKRVLGIGGQAYVYEAEHTQLGRTVALKVPKQDVAERLLKEARLLARLDHPRMVRVEHVGEHEGPDGTVPFLVMEYLEGGSLDHVLEQYSEGMPLEMVQRVATSLLEALAYAHSQGVVHRDVKPSNILFDRDGELKLADLGIGTLSTGPDLDHSIQFTQLTEDGVAVGTPLFMAPEQEDPALLAGESIDGRADLFSFGKMLFLMVTGANPRTIRPASRLRTGLDPAWDDLIFKLVEEDRDKRFDNAEDVVLALGALPDPDRPVIHITREELGEGGEQPTIKVTEKGTVPVGMLVFPENAPLGFLVPPGGERARALFGLFALASLVMTGFMGWKGSEVPSFALAEMWPLILGSGLSTLFFWGFRVGEIRSSKSIGTFGALLIGVLIAAWQPLLFAGRFLTHTTVGEALADPLHHMAHVDFIRLGAVFAVATFVLGLNVLLLYRRRRRPPPPPAGPGRRPPSSKGGSDGPIVKAKPRGIGGVFLRIASVLTGLATLAGSVVLALVSLLVVAVLGVAAFVAELSGHSVDVNLGPIGGIAAGLAVVGVLVGLFLTVPALVRLIRGSPPSTS